MSTSSEHIQFLNQEFHAQSTFFRRSSLPETAATKKNFDNYNFAGPRKQLIHLLKLFDFRVRVGVSKYGSCANNFQIIQSDHLLNIQQSGGTKSKA